MLISLFLLVSCEEDHQFLPEIPTENGISARSTTKNSIYLYPDGDPQILQKALDQAVGSNQRVNIFLAPGVYTIASTEIKNFKGAIIGAGIDKTIIKSVTGIDCQGLANLDIWPTLLKFRLSDVVLKDITFDIDQITCLGKWSPWGDTENGDKYIGAVVMVTGNTYSEDNISEKEHAFSWIENIKFKGIIDSEGNPSVDNHLIFGAEIPNTVDLVKSMDGGKHVVKNCWFETADAGIQVHYTDNTTCEFTGNSFHNIQYWSGIFYDCSYSNIKFNYNHVIQDKRTPIYCDQDFLASELGAGYQEMTHFTFEGNLIEGKYGGSAFVMEDPWMINQNEPSMMVIMKNNTIKMDDAFTGLASYGLYNSIINSNIFTGSSLAGIYAAYKTQKCLYAHNDFSGYDAQVAPFYLSSTSSNCKIIGNEEELVLDFGIDNKILAVKAKTESGKQMIHPEKVEVKRIR